MDASVIGVNQLSRVATKATASAKTVEEVKRGMSAFKTADGLAKGLDGLGMVSAGIDAGIAIAQAYENPTAGNITKAAVKTAIVALEVFGKVNPVAGLILGVLDITGATDALFNW